ncbi:MAG: ABC transporter permease [Clostridiales bacterium]|nr:ABC transporter permease [Clostridiales bacterium]
MVKTLKGIAKWSFVGLILLFIYFPILFLTVNSFNQSDYIQNWTGFGWEHYAYFFNFENEPIRVVGQTMLLAVVVAFLSTLLGTFGAIGLFYAKKRTSATLNALNRIPVINADVVTAISFALLVSFIGLDKSTYIPLILGQMLLCTPFVVLSIIPKLKQMDNNLYEAALDLGATPRKALFSVIIPQILPGILTGFLLSITLSLDDYVIAAYTKPDSFTTISTHIYGLDKNNIMGAKIKAAYWAFTAIIFLIIVLVVILSNVLAYRKTRSKKR